MFCDLTLSPYTRSSTQNSLAILRLKKLQQKSVFLYTLHGLLKAWHPLFSKLNVLSLNAKITNSIPKNTLIKTLFQQEFVTSNFKMLGKLTHIDRTDSSSLTLKSKVDVSKQSDIKLLTTFKTFTMSNLSTSSKVFVPHTSFRSFYINYSKGGSSVMNLKKFFQKWKLTYHLLFNLFFYKINLLTFTPSFFRNEALALNWVEHTQINLLWRYIRPFLASKPNKINDSGEFIFRKLKYLGMSTSLVIDVLYHSKTIYYLRRLNYYSIGLVPTIYHDKFVDFAVPVAADSLLSQVFFVRLLINLKHSVSHKIFVNLKHIWSNRT